MAACLDVEAGCPNATLLCEDQCLEYDFGEGECGTQYIWIHFFTHASDGGLSYVAFGSPDATVEGQLIGAVCDVGCASLNDQLGSTWVPTQVDMDLLPPGHYFLVLKVEPKGDCTGVIDIDFKGNPHCREEEPCISETACENCIPTFMPKPGSQLLVMAWAKDLGSDLDDVDHDDPYIVVAFPGSSQPDTEIDPAGQIIEGWQRLEGVVPVPLDATVVRIELRSHGDEVLFDDVRAQPNDASMKCYVYDPHTLRFVAELDERHYATFYEYDGEGKLARLKKETERGVMTIKESRTYLPEEVTP